MITNKNSWSLGATPNKSLDSFEPSICSHSPSDLTGAGRFLPFSLQAFCIFNSALCTGLIHLPGDPLPTLRRTHLYFRLVTRPRLQSIQSIDSDSCSFVSIRGFRSS